MGNSINKIKCLYLPAQSGKTRKVEEEIQKYNLFNDYFGEINDINLIISANVRLLVCQTASRLQTDLSNEEIIEGPVFTWISGSEECNLSPKELAFDISIGNIEMVIMCAHPKRIKHLYNMVNELSKVRNFKKNVNIWIDEADASLLKWSKYEHIINNPLITNIIPISATFDSVFKKYKRLPVIGFPETHPKCYRCLQDAKCIKVDFAGSAVDYINFILSKNEDLMLPGKRAFIPGDYKKESHNEIRKLLFSYGFCILLINGDEKTLSTRDKDIDLSDFFNINNGIPDELNTILARLYQTHELYRYPFAITGMECIKRGITFQCDVDHEHNGFIFDYGIIPNIQQKVEAYQSMARLFGNVGDFSIFKQVDIFSTSTNFRKIQKQESMAMNIAKMVYERKLEDVGEEELKEAMNFGDNTYGEEPSYGEEPCTTFIELKELMMKKHKRIITCDAIHENTSGILVSTKYGQPSGQIDKNSKEHKNKDDLVPITIGLFNSKSKGSYLSSNGDWAVIPVYTKLEKNSETWYCRFINKKK